MSSFEIQVYCYTLKTPSNEHHYLESPSNILSSLPTDPATGHSHIITRARGGARGNHVSYMPISSLMVTQPFERRSYCHGVVQSDCPRPSENGDKVWLRSDVPLLVGYRGVPVYNITKGVCCEVWIDNVDWRWDKQSIPHPVTPPVTPPTQGTTSTRSAGKSITLVLAGPARASVGGLDRNGPEVVQMAILSAAGSRARPAEGMRDQNQARYPYHQMQPMHQTRRQICCFTVQELEEGWEDIAGKRKSLLAAGAANGADTVAVKRKGVRKTSAM
ncbi:hypothetical protein QBC40DRAFT_280349 [Triangularia verruculosa]|uniref:Uncharacterized protein n=1 Tax=Triangularia verruculosa TaxID=2587418 RepID=A0AAN6XGR2_9PEZI|nr:hypothetical protein QBC40DRAFT_280349 [Triangularia verruculosa]